MKNKNVHVTDSKYWFFKSKKNLSFTYKFLIFIKNIIEKLFKIKISTRPDKMKSHEISSYPISLKLRNNRNLLLYLKPFRNFSYNIGLKFFRKIIFYFLHIFFIYNQTKSNTTIKRF